MVAKSRDALVRVSKAFADRSVKKGYHLVAQGQVSTGSLQLKTSLPQLSKSSSPAAIQRSSD